MTRGAARLTLTAPDGVSVTRYAYQGNQTTVTDPAGKSKTYTSDANGNLTQVSEPNPAGGTLVTLYTYDSLNHLTPSRYARKRDEVRTFTYDPTTQRLSSATTPESGTCNSRRMPTALCRGRSTPRGRRRSTGTILTAG